MRILFSAALVGATLMAAPVLAWSENNMTQPATNEVAVWAYPTKHNYCPAGLQPVMLGGVVCCGTPTHTGYQSHPAPAVHKPRPKATHVSYGKGYSDDTIVYEKGQ